MRRQTMTAGRLRPRSAAEDQRPDVITPRAVTTTHWPSCRFTASTLPTPGRMLPAPTSNRLPLRPSTSARSPWTSCTTQSSTMPVGDLRLGRRRGHGRSSHGRNRTRGLGRGVDLIEPVDGVGNVGELRRRIGRRALDPIEPLGNRDELGIGVADRAVEIGFHRGKLGELRFQRAQNAARIRRIRARGRFGHEPPDAGTGQRSDERTDGRGQCDRCREHRKTP